MPTNRDRTYLRLSDAADMLPCTYRHMRRLVAGGDIPHVRIPGRKPEIFVHLADLQTYAASPKRRRRKT